MTPTATHLSRIPQYAAAARWAQPLALSLNELVHAAGNLGEAPRATDDGAFPMRAAFPPSTPANPHARGWSQPRLLRSRLPFIPASPCPSRPASSSAAAWWPTGRSFASQAEPTAGAHNPPPLLSSSSSSAAPSPAHQQLQTPAAHSAPEGQSKAQAQGEGAQQQQQQQQYDTREAPSRPSNDVVYMGPLAQQHKLLKRISITNTLVALAAAPAIVSWADNISLVSRYGLAASLVFFGVMTTGALHWVAHPYVHELHYQAATGEIRARTTTLLGNSRWHTFNIDDVRPLPWSRPVATFTARNQFYYIDTFAFPDEQLLRRLTPDEADVPKGYKDDKDEDDD